MKIRGKIVFSVWLVVLICSSIFTIIGYRAERQALLEGIDEKLYATASLLRFLFPTDYHDHLNKDSFTPADYDRMIVDRNNKLCRELGVQYIWSCMVVDKNIVFTSSTSPSKDVKKQDHAKFFERYRDPHSFDRVFRTMRPTYSSFRNEWGQGRMVLIPYKDAQGRPYCFGASMNLKAVETILWERLAWDLVLFLCVLLFGFFVSMIVANSFAGPIVKLTSVAENIARGNMEQEVKVSGCVELKSLSTSIDFMRNSIRDKINELQKTLGVVQESEERFKIVSRATNDAIWDWNLHVRMVRWNEGLSTLFGYTLENNETEESWWHERIHPEDKERIISSIHKVVDSQGTHWSGEYRFRRNDNIYAYVFMRGYVIRDETGKAVRMIGSMMDVTASKSLQEERESLLRKLEDLSLKDVETELYNHKYLIERLDSELIRAKRYVLPLSLIMIDIDYFNSINELYGHSYGDVILKEFARYLINFVRGMDVVTRYGGEEFVLILPDTDKQSAAGFARRLLDNIGKHVFDSEGKKIKMMISIGISSFPEDDSGTTALMHVAEKAVSSAKAKGGARFVFFKGKEAEVSIASDVKESVDNLKQKLSSMEKNMNETFLESIYAFAKTLEAKDYYTGTHCEDMISLVTAIGKKLNLPDEYVENLKHAAILHDLGKIGIPDEILLKKGKLTEQEYAIIKKHPQIGAEIIRPIRFLREIVPIILHHHERFDGLGYSTGLKEKEIPLGARIIAVADVYQALTSDRPYRKAYSKGEALDIIQQGSGTQFDPEIVEAFMKIMKTKHPET
ncbi:MAG: HD domain-containing phosphohydrolase [Candidatus Omnitrophota bacterium]